MQDITEQQPVESQKCWETNDPFITEKNNQALNKQEASLCNAKYLHLITTICCIDSTYTDQTSGTEAQIVLCLMLDIVGDVALSWF